MPSSSRYVSARDSLANPVAWVYAKVVDHATGSGWRIPALDGARAVAALLVLAAHSMGASDDPRYSSYAFSPIGRGGVGGVMLFFALSGFLLYLPWLRARTEGTPLPRFSHYAARRCLRIMPAYFASVIILVLMRWLLGGKEPIPASHLILHFVFLPTLGSPLSTVYWSLQVEEFFYWTLHAMDTFVQRFTVWGLLAACCAVSGVWAGFVFALVPAGGRQIWLQNTPFFLPAFALGIVSAVLWQRRQSDAQSGKRLVVIGALGYVAAAPVAQFAAQWSGDLTWVAGLALAPFASCFVLGVARGGAPFLASPVMRFIGGISFSLYLWHMIVIKKAPTPAFVASSFPLFAVYVTVLSVAIAVVMYLAVERPFLMLRPKLSSNPREKQRSSVDELLDEAHEPTA